MIELLAKFGIKKKLDVQKLEQSYFIIKEKQFIKYKPVYSGECIAHQRDERVIPSIDFLQQIGKEAKKKASLNPKGEWLFICGRDVVGKNITLHDNLEIGDTVAVLNQHKECIGYGKIVGSIEEGKTVIKRKFDIGDLLRRER